MDNQFGRTELLLGTQAMERLSRSRVAVFGVGGVGGYAVEALVRSGIGAIDIIDNDIVALSNLNRQIIATHDTIGMLKVDAAEQRIKSINPDCKVTKHAVFYNADTADDFDFCKYDYIVDAIDSVSGKTELIVQADKAGVPIISSMGAGNKMNPEQLKVADIYKTSVCPLARVMRRELRARGIKSLKVVYSEEEAIRPQAGENAEKKGKGIAPGSNAFVPSAAGLIIAAEVIKDITGYGK